MTYCVGILRFHKSRPLYVQFSTDTLNFAGGVGGGGWKSTEENAGLVFRTVSIKMADATHTSGSVNHGKFYAYLYFIHLPLTLKLLSL